MRKLIINRYKTNGDTIHSIITFKSDIHTYYFVGIERKGVEIKKGLYKATIYDSPKFGRSLYMLNVPERQGILVHVGNTYKDTDGCIIIGQYREKNSIINSRNTVNLLHRLSQKKPLNIEICSKKLLTRSYLKQLKDFWKSLLIGWKKHLTSI